MNPLIIMHALPYLRAALKASPQVVEFVNDAITAARGNQSELKQLLADTMAENDEGHARLQDKLA